jgi:hypothetical protein
MTAVGTSEMLRSAFAYTSTLSVSGLSIMLDDRGDAQWEYEVESERRTDNSADHTQY